MLNFPVRSFNKRGNRTRKEVITYEKTLIEKYFIKLNFFTFYEQGILRRYKISCSVRTFLVWFYLLNTVFQTSLDPYETSRVCDRIWKPEVLKLECNGQPRYYYANGKCQSFNYRGGLGTKNSFPDSTACEHMCKCMYIDKYTKLDFVISLLICKKAASSVEHVRTKRNIASWRRETILHVTIDSINVHPNI